MHWLLLERRTSCHEARFRQRDSVACLADISRPLMTATMSTPIVQLRLGPAECHRSIGRLGPVYNWPRSDVNADVFVVVFATLPSLFL